MNTAITASQKLVIALCETLRHSAVAVKCIQDSTSIVSTHFFSQSATLMNQCMSKSKLLRMKSVLAILCLVLVLSSCGKNKNTSNNHHVKGEWVEVSSSGYAEITRG